MITTIALAQAEIRRRLTYIRDNDVFLVGDINYLPPDVMLPAIGIKEGIIQTEELAGGMMRSTFRIQFMIWTEVFKESDALIHSGSRHGVLQIEQDLDEALDENTFGDENIQYAVTISPRPESQPVNDGKKDMQRKLVVYEYVKEANRPSAARA